MHQFLRRFVSILLLVTLLFSVGCVKKEQQVVQKQDKVELVYYKLFDEEDAFAPLIQQYTAQHPNVTIKYRKFTDPVEYMDLIVNELAEGEGPDIFSVPNYWFLRNARKIQPLPSQTFSPAKFEQTFASVANNDLVFADPADGQQKVFGIPLTVDTLALYYNKAAYEDKIPSRGRPAATWEELKDDVFKLSKTDNSFERFEVAGVAMGRSDNILRAVDILYMLMLQYKTTFYNANVSQATFAQQSRTSTAGLAQNPALEALRLYTSFALPSNKNYSWNSYLADGKSDVKEIETFARGKVTMIFGYSYLYEQIKNEIKILKDKGVSTMNPDDIRISAVPQVNDPATSTEKRDAYASYFAETVARTSKNPQQAWDFLMFVSSKENLQYYSTKTKHPTSRRDLIEEQKRDPIYGVFAEQTGYAESFPIYDDVRYEQIFGTAIEQVLATTTTVEDALRTAENRINQLLPDTGLITVPKQPTTNAPNTSSQASR